MVSEGTTALLIGVVSFLIGIALASFIDSHFEQVSCDRLEELTSINMTYTYSKGCQLVSEL